MTSHCPNCTVKDDYITALETLNKALKTALLNSKASLEAQGRWVKKAEAEAKRAKEGLRGTYE